MPLKLVPPRQGKTPNWSIRGTYLGIPVDRSAGTPRKSLAGKLLKDIERRIEGGEYQERKKTLPTFLIAAVAYMKAGKRRRYIKNLIDYFGETPLNQIDQAAIDEAAISLHPNVTPGTRNAQVYTPVSAILRHAGVDLRLRRPNGAKGRVVTDWLTPEDAGAIIRVADTFDPELGLLLRFLLYTGVRLGEALALTWEDVRLEESVAWMRRKKGGIASDVRLREDLRIALAAHRTASEGCGRVFRFHQGGHLKYQLVRAKLAALGLQCPIRRPTGWRQPPNRLAWANFHSFRHTWATWMRRYSGADVQGLVATGNWRDTRSASRYAHAVAKDEWSRVESLPNVEISSTQQRRNAR